MIQFADEAEIEAEGRAIQDLEDHRKDRLRIPFKVEIEWPENGGIWVGVTMGKFNQVSNMQGEQYPIYNGWESIIGKKFDREDTIGDVREWILSVRLGEVKT